MTPITEAAAAKLLCPYRVASYYDRVPFLADINEHTGGCVGSACMLWRAAPQEPKWDTHILTPEMLAPYRQPESLLDEPWRRTEGELMGRAIRRAVDAYVQVHHPDGEVRCSPRLVKAPQGPQSVEVELRILRKPEALGTCGMLR